MHIFYTWLVSTDLVSFDESKSPKHQLLNKSSDEISVTFKSTNKKFGISEVKFTCEPVTCISN